MIPAITTIINRTESQNSIELKWGKPVKTAKIYFNDINHLEEQLKELAEWGYVPEDAYNGGTVQDESN